MDKQQIENALRDYNWMINEIMRERQMLDYNGGKLVAQSGIEAVMPKPQGETSDPVALEVIRRDKKSRKVLKLEKKVSFIQNYMSVITGEKEKNVLDCLLDGMSISDISRHMGVSRKHIYTLKEDITSQMLHFSQISQSCTKEKACV